jgi:hypothetical protein
LKSPKSCNIFDENAQKSMTFAAQRLPRLLKVEIRPNSVPFVPYTASIRATTAVLQNCEEFRTVICGSRARYLCVSIRHYVHLPLIDVNFYFQTAESLASDNNKARISHFVETLDDVKRFNEADLVSS